MRHLSVLIAAAVLVFCQALFTPGEIEAGPRRLTLPKPALLLQQGNVESGSLKNLLTGSWWQPASDRAHCQCHECLQIQFDRSEDNFCVESNQIYISAHYELDEKRNQVKLFFKQPSDLGRGGAALPWKQYDKTKPIAVIDISKAERENLLLVHWIGFTVKGKKAKDKYGEAYEGVYQKNRSMSPP